MRCVYYHNEVNKNYLLRMTKSLPFLAAKPVASLEPIFLHRKQFDNDATNKNDSLHFKKIWSFFSV